MLLFFWFFIRKPKKEYSVVLFWFYSHIFRDYGYNPTIGTFQKTLLVNTHHIIIIWIIGIDSRNIEYIKYEYKQHYDEVVGVVWRKEWRIANTWWWWWWCVINQSHLASFPSFVTIQINQSPSKPLKKNTICLKRYIKRTNHRPPRMYCKKVMKKETTTYVL